MIKVFFTLLSLVLSSGLTAQVKKPENRSIADCEGAMNLFKSGKYSIQFTGSSGINNEFINYPSLVDVMGENTVWVSFIPEYDGVLSLDASISQDYLQMVIFEEDKRDICQDLSDGAAEIKRLVREKTQRSIGLNESIRNGVLYPLEVKSGKKILIGFSTVEKSSAVLILDFIFKENNSELKAANETKIMDLREDEFAPTLSIVVRDKETKEPVIAGLTIEGFKELNATFTGSDFFFNITRTGKGFIRCDAEGYFFYDNEQNFMPGQDQEIIILLDRLGKGKSMQIEEIEFQAGTSDFLQGAEPKLRRLRDFMALNADVLIEIQGHVFEIGDNSITGQKLSEARAKKVMAYLVSNGIDKARMTAVGYGNTKPIFAKPKFAYEEQANRRVEILIK
ncbi:MAG: OmpA family protein [Bacteroidota bacterium]|jgi:outer membrane protein OmpA-like peptidoglycan-associated protein